MLNREQIIKIAKLLVQVCGGWLSLMSGAISIPLAFVALFTEAHPKRYFAMLAFAALWVIVIRTAWKNYQLMEANKKELEAQTNSHEEEKQKRASAYAEQIKALENQFQSLKTQLDDRTLRKLNKDFLGLYLKQLETRIFTIEKMDSNNDVDNLKDGFDDESLLLIGTINTFIIKSIGEGESALFSRQPELKPAADDVLTEEKRRKRMIDRLNCYAKQLEEIIRNY